jgi:AcrR family transcriptional regulator
MNSKIAARRQLQFDALIDAAENRLRANGIPGVKARDLAEEVGVAVGAIYNLVADLDELILRVNVRTMERLHAALLEAAPAPPPSTREAAATRLVAIGLTYRRFASENMRLWRNLFEFALPPGKALPSWAKGKDIQLIGHIREPLRVLMAGADEAGCFLMARTLFSAVHGIVSLGLDEWQIGVPAEMQDAQIEKLVRIICNGLH